MISVFETDIRRCATVGFFMRHWNEPTKRFIFNRGDHNVEIYMFPNAFQGDNICYFATCGVGQGRAHIDEHSIEICLSLPEDLAGATEQEVALLLMNVVEHSYRPDVRFEAHQVLPPVDSCPDSWGAKAFLINHPLWTEQDSFPQYGDAVTVVQIVSIYQSEYIAINKEGLLSFHQKMSSQTELVLSNPNRPPLI